MDTEPVTIHTYGDHRDVGVQVTIPCEPNRALLQSTTNSHQSTTTNDMQSLLRRNTQRIVVIQQINAKVDTILSLLENTAESAHPTTTTCLSPEQSTNPDPDDDPDSNFEIETIATVPLLYAFNELLKSEEYFRKVVDWLELRIALDDEPQQRMHSAYYLIFDPALFICCSWTGAKKDRTIKEKVAFNVLTNIHALFKEIAGQIEVADLKKFFVTKLCHAKERVQHYEALRKSVCRRPFKKNIITP